ncbi:hypothetical protein GCM10025777_11320 [Membranihabitans marinus]
MGERTYGAAIYHKIGFSNGNYEVSINHCLFQGNTSENVGGAIYFDNDRRFKIYTDQKINIKHSKFIENSSRLSGGAISFYNYNSGKNIIHIDSCELIGNFNYGNTLDNDLLADVVRGGAIDIYVHINTTKVRISNSLFKDNKSIFGGAIFNRSHGYYAVDTIDIINSIFQNNEAQQNGAALLNYASGRHLGRFAGYGYLESSLVNNLFIQNVAQKGGTINNHTFNGNINNFIVNNVYYQNKSENSSVVLDSINIHSYTVDDLQGHPDSLITGLAALRLTDTIVNTIFYQNSGKIANLNSSDKINSLIHHSMIDLGSFEYNQSQLMLRSNSPNNNFINTDPLFVDAANGDFSLQYISPAINSGDPSTMADFYMVAGQEVDLALNPRFYNNIDMGVLEYQSDPCDPSPQSMNCISTIHPAIDGQGMMELYINEVVPGLTECANQLSVTVANEWNGQVWRGENLTSQDLIMEGEDLCNYRGQILTVQISNPISSCQSSLFIPQSSSIVLTSDFQSSKTAGDYDLPTAGLSRGKIVTYCGYIPDASLHTPSVTVSCNEGRGPGYYGLAVQPDWIMPISCTEDNDTAELIFRTWEVFNKEGEMTTLTDTIVVMRLPAFGPTSFKGKAEDTTYCEIEAVVDPGETLKRYAAWKQPMGLHDYELPTGKMGAVTYELPAAVVLAGYVNAQSQDLLNEYLACVILKKNDKAQTEYTIGDIIDGSYIADVLANASSSQLGYGALNIVARLADDWENYLIASIGSGYFPYVFLEKGDRVLSADGYYEEVTDQWFWDGNGNSPYWFAAGWPSIYGSGDCVRYCDVVNGDSDECVEVAVPAIQYDGQGYLNFNTELPIYICLDELSGKPHCGINVTSKSTDWTGSCPQTKGRDVVVTQTCYANGDDLGSLPAVVNDDFTDEDFFAGNLAIQPESDFAHYTTTGGVVEYSSEVVSSKPKYIISQWLTLQDTIGPVFDFCYPVDGGGIEGDCAMDNCEIGEWNHEGRWIGNLVNMDLKLNMRRYVPSGYVVLTDEEYQTLSDYEQSQFKPYPSEIEEAIRAGEQYESANDWEQCHPTVYTTESHDCAADVFVPSVTLKDNCSGVHSVKAMVNGRAVQLERLATTDEGYVTFAHTSNPIRIAFGGHGVQTEVRYEAADSCWNQSEWFKYIEIKDATPPTVVMDDEVLVSLTTKEAWVKAETFDEGSWDNCGIDLMLARRTDWWSDTACVDLCPTGETYTDWADLLSDLGFSGYGGALGGEYQCGDYDFDITALKKFLNSETVENHYYQKLVWLWEDSYECGEFVVHGWIYDMVKYILLNDNCSGPDADHGNRLKIEEFEGFLDAITGKPGYGKEVSYLGGGWSPAIPFKCEDACETPTVELLVMDYWCNWGKGWLDVEVEDKSQAKVHSALADVAISCESYNVNYKSIIEAAAAYGEGGSAIDSTGAFDALNEAFGYYEAAWVNSNGLITDAAGNEITIEDLRFAIENITCAETEEVTKVADTLHDGTIDWINVTERTTSLVNDSMDHYLGLLAVSCQSSIQHQDVWVDLDDCGNGIITRRFDISGGCGPKAPSFTLEQIIYVNSACELGMSMFDTPADTYTQESSACVTSLEAASTELAPSVTGKVELKADLVGALCNSIAIGVKEEYISEVQTTGTDGPQMYKLTRVWNIRDWCSTIERDYEQTIVFVVDANCAANNGDVSLTGQITDQDQGAIAEVEVKAVLNSGSPLTAETTGNGQYGFNLNYGSSVNIVPQKNTGHGQGITTQDVIAIQSHVMQESVLTSDFDKVAADVDGNGKINAFDILETRRMVLTPNRKLANNTSWRFFMSDGSMRESFESTSLRADQNIDFVGVKIGDVNRTENVGRSQRSGLTTLNLSVVDQGLISGELYRVDVTSANFDEITGMQYTLAYANNAVEVESIEGGALNFTEDNYVKYRPGFITASWSEGKAISASENEVLFTLVVRAKADVSLRDVLSVSDRVIMAEAYTGAEKLKNIQWQYNSSDAIFALYQNTPNPYAGQTAIGFTLPEASEATLTMYDVTGKVLKVIEGSYGKGYNKVWVNSEDFGMSSVLYYQLDTEKYTATKKMVVIK